MSKVETTRKHRWFASPDRELSIADYLFGWASVLSPSDFLTLSNWKREFTERRRVFFELDGDRRYSRSRILGFLSWLLPRRSKTRRRDPSFDAGDAWKRGRTAKSNSQKKERERHGSGEGRQRQQQRRADEPKRERDARAEIPHPYRILGLAVDATDAEIRRAFRELARRYHPDKLRGHEEDVIDRANERLRELIDAYETLGKSRADSAGEDR